MGESARQVCTRCCDLQRVEIPAMTAPDRGYGPLVAALRRMGLVHQSETPQFTPLSGGVSSLILLARTSRGLFCVKQALPRLKVVQEWYAPVERNRAEVAWLRVAARIANDCVPRVVGEDEQTRCFAMAYLDPVAYPVWKTQLKEGVIEPRTARAVAENMAAIHGATAGANDLARRFASDDAFHALRLDAYFVATARVHQDLAPELHRLVDTTARTKRVLVHGDISPKNILVGPRGPVFLDAECAWYGDPAFDLAFCLNHLLLKCIWRPEHADRYLACFALIAQTYFGRVSWEPVRALEARTVALLAAMLLARIDGKSPVEYVTDERDRAVVRRFARSRVAAAPARLQDVAGDWAAEWKHEWERRD